MRVVFFQGAFDFINWGHIRAIKRAAAQGDYLIIGLNTDKLYRKYKGREPILPFWQKKEILESIKGVDKVVPARTFSPMNLLKKYNVDVYVLAREWENTKAEEIAYMKAKGGKVVYTIRPRGLISTTEMKETILKAGE